MVGIKKNHFICLGIFILCSCVKQGPTFYKSDIFLTFRKEVFLNFTKPILSYTVDKTFRSIDILIFEPRRRILLILPLFNCKKILLVEERSNIGVDRIMVKNYEYFFENGKLFLLFDLPYVYFLESCYNPIIKIYCITHNNHKYVKIIKYIRFIWKPMKKSEYPYSYEYFSSLKEVIENFKIKEINEHILSELKQELKVINIAHFSPYYRKLLIKLKKQLENIK